jgi:hypothetical protein
VTERCAVAYPLLGKVPVDPWSVPDRSPLVAKLSTDVISKTCAKVITDRETGKHRGFGFVKFAKESDMLKVSRILLVSAIVLVTRTV